VSRGRARSIRRVLVDDARGRDRLRPAAEANAMILAALPYVALCMLAPGDDEPLGDDADPADAEPIDDVEPTPPNEPSEGGLPDPLPTGQTGAAGPTETAADGDTVPSEAAIERQRDAQIDEPAKKKKRFERDGSPQRFEAEFKIGPWLPDVDRLYDGPGLGPYATIFGETNSMGVATGRPKPGVMPSAAFEWQFLYVAGTLGVGTQLGFFTDKAKAILAQPMPGENIRSEADSTRFGMVPIVVFLAYRFEYLADRYRWMPLVPYAKAGVGYAFWWTKDGNGKVSTNSMGQKGRGGVPGWQLNFGGMLRLDFIEPGTAKKLDKTTGINHVYVFGEYQIARYNNFGIGDSISIGGNTWFAGLAIEF
jgi:hypothetical protein